ncbi:MAG: hypothetical protein PHY92_03820 [Alphaproteobacteria bacterium]|nr:hypothetical protein [Alphaproteobacteria bacterium]
MRFRLVIFASGLIFFGLFAADALAQAVPGYCDPRHNGGVSCIPGYCNQLGATTMDADNASLIACLRTAKDGGANCTDWGCTWKVMATENKCQCRLATGARGEDCDFAEVWQIKCGTADWVDVHWWCAKGQTNHTGITTIYDCSYTAAPPCDGCL